MTPNDLEVLIHCHCSPERHPRLDAPAVLKALVRLEREGLIEKTSVPGAFGATPLGAEHIRQLCALAVPAVPAVPDWRKLGEVYAAARRVEVSFSLSYDESGDVWSFSVYSAAPSERWEGKEHSFDLAVECVMEWLHKLEGL